MLTQEQVLEIREALEKSKRPFIFFHDDPDGLASFVMLYKHVQRGKGRVVKAFPNIKQELADKVQAYGADAVFIVDIAMVEQEFIDSVGVPVYWIDHHEPQEREGVHYYNPRINTGENIPATVLVRQITQENIWIAAIGALGDWHWPHFIEEYRAKHPELLPAEIRTEEKALFESPTGTLVQIFSFILKGQSQKMLQNIKVLTRIEAPEEILKQTTSKGKYLWKHYQQVLQEYNKLLKKALEKEPERGVLVFTYEQDKLSLTKDLANELLYRVPQTIIVLGRRKSGEVRCSLRANHLNLRELLEKALEDIEGRGGGHEHACGAAIKEEDFERFVEKLREPSR